MIVAWGENEPDEFKRQSQAFASVLRESAFPVKTLEARGANHFDIVFEIADPETALGRLTLDLMAGGRNAALIDDLDLPREITAARAELRTDRLEKFFRKKIHIHK